jgi:hypothetical protein
MAIERIRIDYTVYSPNYRTGEGLCLGFDTFRRAKASARSLGTGSRIYRNFNQKNKKGHVLGDWWTADRYWLWDDETFRKLTDSSPVV